MEPEYGGDKKDPRLQTTASLMHSNGVMWLQKKKQIMPNPMLGFIIKV